jgi:hypothetical protein
VNVNQLLQVARARIDLMNRTIDLARTLRQTQPQRLAGVMFQTGQPTLQNLASEQLRRMGPALTARGINPVLVTGRITPAVQAILNAIKLIPESAQRAAAQVSAAVMAGRAALSRAQVSLLVRMLGSHLSRLWGLVTLPLWPFLFFKPLFYDEDGNLRTFRSRGDEIA